MLIAGGIALERLPPAPHAGAVARLVLDIGAAPAPGELRAPRRHARRPRAELLHASKRDGWTTTGRAVESPAAGDRAVTLVRAGGEDVLAVVHRRGLLDDPQLVDELATTARLAIDHERLQAAHRARLAELRASRVRIVAAADRERRALERDLHDGAQQRLVTLGLSIRLARRVPRPRTPRLAAAEDQRAGGGRRPARGRARPLPDRAGRRGPRARDRRALRAGAAADRAACRTAASRTPSSPPRTSPRARRCASPSAR